MVNIEMNYFDGKSYIALAPKGDFGNMGGSLNSNQVPGLDASKIVSGNLSNDRMPSGSVKSQIISYVGTRGNSAGDGGDVSQALLYTNPHFVMGGNLQGNNSNSTSGTLSFGNFCNWSDVGMIYIEVTYRNIEIGCYSAKVNNKTLTFYEGKYECSKNLNVESSSVTCSNGQYWQAYNWVNQQYMYLVIY